MTTAPRRVAKPRTPRPVEPVPNEPQKDDVEPDPGPDRVNLFMVDDVWYSIPKRPPANLLVKYLVLVRNRGYDLAIIQILEDLAGHDALIALVGNENLTHDELGTVFNAVQHVMTGTLQEDAGN